MRTVGRSACLLLGLCVAAYVTSLDMGSDGINPPNQAQQLSQAAPSGYPVASQSEEPSFSLNQPTVVTVLERAMERFDALAQIPVPRGHDAIGREL
jgi:hypothetical protein